MTKTKTAKAKEVPAVPVAASSNWKALKQVRILGCSALEICTQTDLRRALCVQALRPAGESPEKPKATKRKRSRSDAGSATPEPSRASSKGKEREEEAAPGVKTNKKELPIASILGSDQAAWQQE